MLYTPAAFDLETNTSKLYQFFCSGTYVVGASKQRFEDGGRDSGNWAGAYGACFDAAKVEFSQDTDGDGLADVWEAANGTQVTVADADADPDHDGLTNIQEFTAGTKANDPDTDHDGLLDGVENGTGSWGGPNFTGTFPLIADSDRDGILDGAENPDNPYVDLAHSGTDPNTADSDFDGVTDYREILSGTNPKDPNQFPAFTYTDLMKENFDGNSVNSVTSFSKGGTGGYTPAVTASGNPLHNNVAKLLNSTNLSNSNSLAFDQIPSNAVAVKFSFDFSMSSGADGIGFGFFKTSDFPATGPINPGSVDSWENPTSGSGIKGVAIGLSGYHSAVVMNSPKDPTKALYSGTTGLLTDGLYDRVVVTAIANSPGSTAFSVDLILDVDGPDPFTMNLFSAVVAEGFDISTDPYRIVIGGRTGGLAMNATVDNVVLSTNGVIAPPEQPVMTASTIDRSATPAKFVMTWSSRPGSTYKLESNPTLTGAWSTVAASIASGGTTTTYNVPLPAGSPAKNFFRISPN
ncbi:MAG: ATPase containing von Willebrand factor type (vWA) protein-like omain, partial [Akkermansiaceae bacterium]|nr:ATPase containing von Willebrand factor type (vWA) protein-like omain [Akkermansiaceae bacterium]